MTSIIARAVVGTDLEAMALSSCWSVLNARNGELAKNVDPAKPAG
jgi:hypothetical protein